MVWWLHNISSFLANELVLPLWTRALELVQSEMLSENLAITDGLGPLKHVQAAIYVDQKIMNFNVSNPDRRYVCVYSTIAYSYGSHYMFLLATVGDVCVVYTCVCLRLG